MFKTNSIFSGLAATVVLLGSAGIAPVWADSTCTSNAFTISSSKGSSFPATGGSTTLSWSKGTGASNSCPSFITTTASWVTLQATNSPSTTGSAGVTLGPNLSSATRTATITVQSSPTDSTNFSLTQTGTTLTVDMTSLTFTAPGGAAPLPQTINVSASGGPVQFAAQPTSTGNWLSVSTSSGATPSAVTVSVNPSGLTAGTYNGAVQIIGAGLQVPVTVMLTVTSAAPALNFTPTSTAISGPAGSATAATAAVILKNTSGSASIVYTVLTDQDWLVATSSGNSTLNPGQSTPVTISALAANLKPGSYTGHVTASGSGVIATLTVTFNVTGSSITAPVNPITLSISSGIKKTFAGVGQLAGDSANVAISVTSGSSFISADATAKSPGAFGVTIDATALNAGNYSGSLLVQCTGTSSCLPLMVQVIVTVNPGSGSLNFVPATATLSLPAGSAAPQTASVSIENDGSSATNFTITTDQSWLSATPTTGSVAAGQRTAVSISATTASLQPGSYTGHLLAQGTGTTATYTVTLTVTGAVVTVSPNPLTVTLPTNTRQTFPGAVQLGGGAAAVTINVTQGNAYLTADSVSQSPGSFSVMVDATKLTPGTYPGALVVHCTLGCVPTTVALSIVVTLGTTNLSFASPGTTLTGNAGSASPQAASTTLTNNGTGPSNFTLTTDQSWLSAIPSGGALNAGQSLTIAITASPQNLTPGTYTGHLTAGAAVFTVTFTVAGTSLYVLPSPASFTVPTGTKQTFNTLQLLGGSGPVSIAVTSGSIWLSADQAVQAPGNVNLTVDATYLKPGSYSGALSFTCQAACVPFNVQINLTVTTSGGLVLSPATISFTSYQGRPAAAAQTVTVKSSDGSAVGFSIANPFSWLGISALSGTTPATLTLTPNLTGLTSSVSGNLTFTAANTSAVVLLPVTLNFTPFTISATPNPLTINAVVGQRTQAVLTVGTVDGGSASLQVTTASFWLTVPSSFTAPGSFTIQVDASKLGTGAYPGMVTLSCANANPCQAIQVPVNLLVTNMPMLLSDTPSIGFPLPSNGTSTPTSQAVHLTSSDGSTAISYTIDPNTLPRWLSVSADQVTTPATLTFSVPTPPTQQQAANVKVTSAYGNVVIAVTYSFATTPSINSAGVVSAGGLQSKLRAGSWGTIYGANFTSSAGRDWRPTDFNGNAFPTSLDGVSVTVGGQAAFVRTISPGQINFQCPDGVGTGAIPVMVKNSLGVSNTVMATVDNYAPAFFVASTVNSRSYVAATETASGGAVYIGPANTAGVRPAKSGENLTLWGTGFGPTTPNVPAGSIFNDAAPLNDAVQILLDGVALTPQFAGLSGAGLYQFNIVVPDLPPGDHKLAAMIGGVTTADGIWLATQ